MEMYLCEVTSAGKAWLESLELTLAKKKMGPARNSFFHESLGK